MRQLSAMITGLVLCASSLTVRAEDFVRQLQTAAIEAGKVPWGYWGADTGNYIAWGSHSNRLIPVYTFGTKGAAAGVDLTAYQGTHSPYRSETELRRLYGRVPTHTVNPQAEYFDQTNLFDLQKAALAAGKKYVFLVVFDGMDWQSTRNTAIYQTGKVGYEAGRGSGLHFLDYTACGTTQFGWMCTSPHNDGTSTDVNAQTVKNPGGKLFGGFDVSSFGPYPWSNAADPLYPISQAKAADRKHAYTDSSSSASSMTAGIKTFNDGVNIDYQGVPVQTIARTSHNSRATPSARFPASPSVMQLRPAVMPSMCRATTIRT